MGSRLKLKSYMFLESLGTIATYPFCEELWEETVGIWAGLIGFCSLEVVWDWDEHNSARDNAGFRQFTH